MVCSERWVGAQKHKFRFLSIHLKNFLESLTIFCEWLRIFSQTLAKIIVSMSDEGSLYLMNNT